MESSSRWTSLASFNSVNRECVICDCADRLEWAEGDGFAAVQCAGCNYIWIDPAMSEPDLEAHYANYIGRRVEDTEMMRLRSEQYRIDADHLRSFVASGSVLDVGCNGGFFLDELGGSFVRHGLELDPVAAEYARSEYGFDVRRERLGEDTFESGSFDLVVMRGVIEHVLHPDKALQRVSELLKTGGTFFISATPNVESFCADLYREKWNLYNPVDHINLFSFATLSTLCERNDLSSVSVSYPYLETPYAAPVKDNAVIQEAVLLKSQNRWSEVDTSPAFWGNMMTAIFRKNSYGRDK